MRQIIDESKDIILRRTQIEDLDYVLSSEREPDNAKYVGQWTREQHISSLSQSDIMHLIVEEAATGKAVGYIIMAGLKNPNNSIEFRRIAISDKGKGYGRAALKLIKRVAFEQLKAHRLWLDVRSKNLRAQALYQSEGFIIEGTHRECILYNGEYESLIVMAILESEF
jgi:RimJ/RimL family protein N-acetyltransferase